MVGEHNSYFIIVCKYKRKHAIQILIQIQFKFSWTNQKPYQGIILVLFRQTYNLVCTGV